MRLIVRHDDAMQGGCPFQDFTVLTADQPLLADRPHVAASCQNAGDHVSGDVFVSKRGKSSGLTQSS